MELVMLNTTPPYYETNDWHMLKWASWTCRLFVTWHDVTCTFYHSETGPLMKLSNKKTTSRIFVCVFLLFIVISKIETRSSILSQMNPVHTPILVLQDPL